MHKRILIICLSVLLAGVSAPLAMAISVSVRVEGKTQTIYGAAEPRLKLTTGASALDALETASIAGEFYYHLTTTSLGSYVDQIGRYPASGNGGWVFKVNGVSPPVGASSVKLKNGDRVLWYWANFNPTTFAGPKTLELTHTTGYCYAAFSEDDQGVRAPALGAVLHIGSAKTVKTKAGRACVGRHAGMLVRATLAGTVRSNALR